MDVSVPPVTTAEELKTHVAAAWSVHPSCQQLVVGTEMLIGFESIESLVSKELSRTGAPLLVTVITSQAPLPLGIAEKFAVEIAKFESPDSRVRRWAISRLVNEVDVSCQRQMDVFVDEVHVAALNACQSVAVKCTGLQALAQVSPKGHARSIRVAAQLLEDKHDFVWLTAVETVAALAPAGDEATILLAKRLVRSSRISVKVAGIMVLGEVALEDSSGVMDLFVKLSEHADETVRTAANDAVFLVLGRS